MSLDQTVCEGKILTRLKKVINVTLHVNIN